MKLFISSIVTVGCLSLILFFCNCKNGANKYQKVNFNTVILSIANNSRNVCVYDELFGVDQFIPLYEHSEFYTKDVIQFLASPKFTTRQKKIAVCAMQRLSIKDYIQFCSECYELYKKKEISEDVLDLAIEPNFSNRHNMATHFYKLKVRALLKQIKRDSTISNNSKSVIDNILSGKLLYSLWDNGALK